MILTLFVPNGRIWIEIRHGSGIVGTVVEGGQVVIDYEGNLYGAQNLECYRDRVLHAADRHVTKYPTVARAWVKGQEVLPVGTYDTESRDFEIFNRPALSAWVAPGADCISDSAGICLFHHVDHLEEEGV